MNVNQRILLSDNINPSRIKRSPFNIIILTNIFSFQDIIILNFRVYQAFFHTLVLVIIMG